MYIIPFLGLFNFINLYHSTYIIPLLRVIYQFLSTSITARVYHTLSDSRILSTDIIARISYSICYLCFLSSYFIARFSYPFANVLLDNTYIFPKRILETSSVDHFEAMFQRICIVWATEIQ